VTLISRNLNRSAEIPEINRGEKMKKQILRMIGGVTVAVVALGVFAQVWVPVQAQKGNEQTLIGSWDSQVTLRDCNSGVPFVTFAAMNTYNQGGTAQQTAIPEPGSTALPGHGAWSHDLGRSYSGAFQFFMLNPNPALTARVIVRSSITLDLGGDSYSSTDTAEILNLNGDVLDRACSTTAATRFK
jgi:hypothetical protein